MFVLYPLFRDKIKIQTEKALNGVKLGMVS